MSKVSDILQIKSNKVISVTPDTSVLDALKIMAQKNVGSILVMDGDTYLGIMTERDYARKVILKDKSSVETAVSEIMSTDLPRIEPNASVEYCMKLMADGNVRYLPVFENGMLVGIISILDVIKATVDAQKATINNLQDFISSNYG